MAKALGGPLTPGQLAARRAKAIAATRAFNFVALCQTRQLPRPVQEFEFWNGRKFAFDFAWPDLQLALESEGGAFVAGRHARGAGMRADLEKYNEAALRGWMVLRVLSDKLATLETVEMIDRAMRARLSSRR